MKISFFSLSLALFLTLSFGGGVLADDSAPAPDFTSAFGAAMNAKTTTAPNGVPISAAEAQAISKAAQTPAEMTANGDVLKLRGIPSFSLKPLMPAGAELGHSSIDGFINYIIVFLAKTIGIFSILGIMIGGVIMILTGASEENAKKGKTIMIASIVGLLVTLGAYLIISFVQYLLYNTWL